MLIVAHDFVIDSDRETWRLHADQTDYEARSWALRLLAGLLGAAGAPVRHWRPRTAARHGQHHPAAS